MRGPRRFRCVGQRFGVVLRVVFGGLLRLGRGLWLDRRCRWVCFGGVASLRLHLRLRLDYGV